MPVSPASVSTLSVTKLRPGQQTMTRAAVIFTGVPILGIWVRLSGGQTTRPLDLIIAAN